MNLNNLVNRINRKLAGELLSYYELKDYLDDTIDDINQRLGSIYPAFSELDSSVTEYDFFPDTWIRKCVVFGAAWYYFVADEEGISTAETYQVLYERNLFEMQRDFVSQVPEEYKKGYVDPSTLEEGEEAPVNDFGTTGESSSQGVVVDGINWKL
jgi:hypothetical protein